MIMESIRRNTDLLRPEVALGGTVEFLSLPQHDVMSDVQAEQKQNVTILPCGNKQIISISSRTKLQERSFIKSMKS